MKEKHIENLSRGRTSGARIGSRGVPHRLRHYEQSQFSRARKQKYLRIPFDSRENVVNIWRKYCSAKAWECIILFQRQDGSVVLEKGEQRLKFNELKSAVDFTKSLLAKPTEI